MSLIIVVWLWCGMVIEDGIGRGVVMMIFVVIWWYKFFFVI